MFDMSSDAALTHVLGQDAALLQKVRKAKILLVGAGGIGCEVIKTLLLTGFTDVHLIDLDTIDVSNLNRQFLFNKTHVGKGKAEVAAAVAVARFAHKDVTGVSVRPDKTEIQQKEFTFDFFRSFTLVINALDNRAARSHVNRMCLAADVPLIESGSEGYQGQVYLIKKGVSMCYECEGPKQEQKTFASCTIRNTPSLPIHCIVWAKHLFSQLFGEQDADNDVSPDITDPELQQSAQTNGDSGTKNQKSESTRKWAASHDYDPDLLFDKFFDRDIHTLLTMDKLWESRRKPVPLSREDLLNDRVHEAGTSGTTTNGHSGDLKEQRVWSLRECYDVFRNSVNLMKDQLNQMNNDSENAKDKFLVWDKDDEAALNFVTAVSNLRSFCFSIERKSRFDVKSMAGNIIPAIASTNSIVGGLIVLQTLSLLRKLPDSREEMTALTKQQREQIFKESCRHIYLRIVSQNAKNLVAAYELFDPKSDCFVCASGSRELEISCCFSETRLVDFVQQIVVKRLHFVCPDIQVEGTATLLYNKEDADDESDDEREQSEKRLLSDFKDLHHNVRLRVYDLTQNYTVLVILKNEKVDPNQNDGQHFRIVVVSEGTDENGKESKEQTDSPEAQPMTTASEVTLSDDESGPIAVAGVKQTDVPLKRAPRNSNGSEVVTPPKKKRTD